MNKGPFRYDQVGSLLRTKELKEAKKALESNQLTQTAYKQIEREEIKKIVQKQKEIGLKAITDGEFNREYWHYDFISYLNGIENYVMDATGKFHGTMNKLKSYYVKEALAFPKDHPFLDDFKYLKELVGHDAIAKSTIPGPNMVYYSGVVNNSLYKEQTTYTSLEALKHDLAKVYQDAIQAYYDAGCRYLQFDDTAWGALFGYEQRKAMQLRGIDPKTLVKEFGDITVEALCKKPADMTITTHCCRGNFKSTWLYDGDYSFVESEIFRAPFDGFFLEYDSERAGGFEPIKQIQHGKLVLGLITTKTGTLEEPNAIKQKIAEASSYLPLDQLCLSCQCGFSSTEDGNELSETEQYNKLALVKRIAEEIWEDA